jgi:imidazolonepropionase-like amidohydrolase
VSLSLHGGLVFDGTGTEPVMADVSIEGDAIAAVGTCPSAAVRVDVAGLTLLPGLIDAHAHPGLPSPAPGANDVSRAEIAGLLFQHCAQMLDAGFTTVRYTGGVDGGLVRAVDRGFVPGPRILTAGPVLCQCGGHGHYAPTFSDGSSPEAMWQPGLLVFARVCDGPDEVRRAAREAFRQGATFLKMCITGGVVSVSDGLDDTQFTVTEIRAAVEEASARGTYVTVHAHNNAGIRNALDAGAKCIEHGTDLNEENAARMAAEGVALVPTLNVLHQLAKQDLGDIPKHTERLGATRDGMQQAIKVALDAGVSVGAGSDLIGPVQQQRGLEVALRAQITSPTEALTAMTSTNARIVRDIRIGQVAVGYRADLIAVDGDPLTEPELLAESDRVVLVVKDGQVVKDRDGRVG